MVYSKDEATDFSADIANANNFKSFENNSRLFTAAQPNPNHANRILKIAATAALLKYLSNFLEIT